MFGRLTAIYLHGCILKRKGSRQSLCQNPTNGVVEAVSRHVEIDNRLVEKICKQRGIPQPGEASANSLGCFMIMMQQTRTHETL